MSTLRSDALDLEKGLAGSNPAPAASMTGALATQEEEVTDPRKARLVNIAIVVFCVVVTLVFAYTMYSLFGDGGPVSGEAFACAAVAFLLCAGPLCTVLALRKDIVSIFAEVRPHAAS